MTMSAGRIEHGDHVARESFSSGTVRPRSPGAADRPGVVFSAGQIVTLTVPRGGYMVKYPGGRGDGLPVYGRPDS